MKYAFHTAAALALATIGLAGCGQQGDQPAAEDAAPEGFPGISVSNGRLILPAVKGNPAVVYFDLAYSGDRTAVLRSADVQGAKSAMLHETVETENGSTMGEMFPLTLTDGTTVKFEPGGKHVMAMELDDSVQEGGTVEVTLIFAGGDKYTFNAEVLPANAAR